MADGTEEEAYQLDRQVGFLLRRATQRHLAIFAGRIANLTPTQFAALAHLAASGPTSQNALGRAIAMDAATIKGVVDRLRGKGYVAAAPSDGDRRRVLLSLTTDGQAAFDLLLPRARAITAETLAPLNDDERAVLVALLTRIG